MTRDATPPMRGITVTAFALCANAVALETARGANLAGTVATAAAYLALVALGATALIIATMRLMGRAVPRRTAARVLMEMTGTLAFSAPVVLIVALVEGWI